MLALIAKKIGMTQVFDDEGALIPITVLEVKPNMVVGNRNKEKNGYDAVIVGAVDVKKSKLTKPVQGQFSEKIGPKKILKEFRNFDKECQIGDELGVELFEGVAFVDVQGVSKGKGFQGVIKRHGFSGGRATHGSKFHRANGSTGMAAYPSKVMKGTKMPGHMGNATTKVQNLKIVRVDKEKNILLVRGSIPGARDSVVIVSSARKKS